MIACTGHVKHRAVAKLTQRLVAYSVARICKLLHSFTPGPLEPARTGRCSPVIARRKQLGDALPIGRLGWRSALLEDSRSTRREAPGRG